MTRDTVLHDTATRYLADLKSRRNISPKKNRLATEPNDRLAHVAWMCVQIQTFSQTHETEKAEAGLEFVRGVLWMAGLYRIEEMT